MLVDKKFNVLKHSLVPEHVIIKEDEIKALFEKYNIISEQLPKIRRNDIICKTIGAKEGDIIRINRKSITAGETIYYRLVIKG